MYGATEELWFMDWEFGGPPWSNPELYKKWSPSEYASALGKFKTPTLVIGGELDYRVPYTQSLEFFTALQRQGVPSKLMIFPDEGHWILKPQNSELWYKTFLDWLADISSLSKIVESWVAAREVRYRISTAATKAINNAASFIQSTAGCGRHRN